MYKKIVCLMLLSGSFYSYANSQLERIVEAQGQLLTQYQQQISDLQSEVDQLRGEQETTSYQLKQVVERQKMILQMVDTLQSAKAAEPKVAAKPTLVDWQPTGNDRDDYNYIIKFVLNGTESKEAITAFQQFLKDYPKSTYRSNVNYWLGQLCNNLNRKDDASFYFATVVKDYPKSTKAGQSLYKVGALLLEKGEKAKAKAVFQQVLKQYPNNKEAVKAATDHLASLG